MSVPSEFKPYLDKLMEAIGKYSLRVFTSPSTMILNYRIGESRLHKNEAIICWAIGSSFPLILAYADKIPYFDMSPDMPLAIFFVLSSFGCYLYQLRKCQAGRVSKPLHIWDSQSHGYVWFGGQTEAERRWQQPVLILSIFAVLEWIGFHFLGGYFLVVALAKFIEIHLLISKKYQILIEEQDDMLNEGVVSPEGMFQFLDINNALIDPSRARQEIPKEIFFTDQNEVKERAVRLKARYLEATRQYGYVPTLKDGHEDELAIDQFEENDFEPSHEQKS